MIQISNLDLLDMLAEQIIDLTKDFQLSTKVKDIVKIPDVHIGYLPPKMKNIQNTEYPYVIIKFSNESSKPHEISKTRVYIIAGAYSEDVEGWKDVLNILNRIKVGLMKLPFIGPFEIIEYTTDLPEEQPLPEWIAYSVIDLSAPTIRQEVF